PIEKGWQRNLPAVDTSARGDCETAGGRFADRSREPEPVAGPGVLAREEAPAFRSGAQEGEGGGRRLRVAREVATRELHTVVFAGGEESLEETPMIEALGRGKGEESVGWQGSGGGQVRKVDG